MITSVKQAKQLLKEYNAIKGDKERLYFLKNHKNSLKVVLDNDQTMVNFNLIVVEDEVQEEAIEELNSDLNSFDDYHGANDANVMLFEFAGISAEQC